MDLTRYQKANFQLSSQQAFLILYIETQTRINSSWNKRLRRINLVMMNIYTNIDWSDCGAMNDTIGTR